MKDNFFLDISFYQIKLFLLLVEHRSFSKVAALTNIAQPTLSKRIAQLEQMLGFKLFDRDKRPFELTSEAKMLYEGWCGLCDQFDDTLRQVAVAKGEIKKRLIISAPDSSNYSLSLLRISNLIHKAYPEIDISQHYLPLSQWRAKLMAGEIDIMLTAKFDTGVLDSSFVSKQLMNLPVEVCMLNNNPLASKESISFEDLKTQNFVSISPLESLEYNRNLHLVCAENGFAPVIVRYASNASSLLSSLCKNDEVALCDSLLRDIDSDALKRFSLPEIQSGLVAVWKKDIVNENILGILEIIKTQAEMVL